jgi:hypothetical protein
LQCKLQHDVAKKVELNLESSVLTNFLSGVLNAANLQTEKLPGDLQDAEYLFDSGFQFREEFLLLSRKCDLRVGGQDRAYSKRPKSRRCCTTFTKVRALGSIFSFHRRFAVLALNVHGLRYRSKSYRFSPGW